MPGLFGEYKIAVLDSSFFTAKFSQNVKSGLASIKVYVAGTFNSELEQYRLFLSKEKLDIFNSNLAFLTDTLFVNTFDMATAGEKAADLQNDIWGLITFLAKLNGRFVVITANQILIQRMILNDVPADIFDLNTNKFKRSKSFNSYRATYEFGQAWAPLPKPVKTAKEGDFLFKRGGDIIRLGAEIHSGLEGVLYRVDKHDQIVAKIFNEGELPRNKFANLKSIAGINNRYDIPFVAFPIDLLYYDSACKIPAGFTETLVHSGDNLGDNPLYLGNISDCPDTKMELRQSDSVDLCLKVIRQICYLNVLGFFISDFNYSNFSTGNATSPYVQMWDSDSFGYGKYFSEIDAGYKLSRTYNYFLKSDAIASCYDELYLFAFSILSLGDYPISEKDGVFKYSKADYLSRPVAQSRKKLFPTRLWALFEEVFTHKKEPSAEVLLDQLTITLQELKENPDTDKSYKTLLSEDLSGSSGAHAANDVAVKIDIIANQKSQNNSSSIGTRNFTATSNVSSTNSNTNTSSKSPVTVSRTGNRKVNVGLWIGILIGLVLLIFLVNNAKAATDTQINTPNNMGTQESAATSSFASSEPIESIDFTTMGVQEAERVIDGYGWKVEKLSIADGNVRAGEISTYLFDSETKQVSLYISEGGFFDGLAPTSDSVSVISNRSEITLSSGTSQTITITGIGSGLPDDFYYKVWWYPEVTTEWGDWYDDGVSCTLTFTGTAKSSGYARIFLVDSETDNKLAYTDVFITVN